MPCPVKGLDHLAVERLPRRRRNWRVCHAETLALHAAVPSLTPRRARLGDLHARPSRRRRFLPAGAFRRVPARGGRGAPARPRRDRAPGPEPEQRRTESGRARRPGRLWDLGPTRRRGARRDALSSRHGVREGPGSECLSAAKPFPAVEELIETVPSFFGRAGPQIRGLCFAEPIGHPSSFSRPATTTPLPSTCGPSVAPSRIFSVHSRCRLRPLPTAKPRRIRSCARTGSTRLLNRNPVRGERRSSMRG